MIKRANDKRQSLLELSKTYRAPRNDALRSFYESTDINSDPDVLSQMDSEMLNEVSNAEKSKFSTFKGQMGWHQSLRNSNTYFHSTTRNTMN